VQTFNIQPTNPSFKSGEPMKKKSCPYDPHKTERNVVKGAPDITRIAVGGAIVVGAMGLLGSVFGKK